MTGMPPHQTESSSQPAGDAAGRPAGRPAGSAPQRLLLVGAGGMGRAWLETILAEPRAELVGVVDLDLEAARAALAAAGAPQVPVGDDVVALADRTAADAVVDVTVPAAHHRVTTDALVAGYPVLGEKPAAATVPEALSLAAASEVTGRLFMVSQSRRFNPQLFRLRDHARALGAAGVLSTEFFKAPRFGGFREQMAHPLLVDMAIHPFDAARLVLDAEPVSVYCEEHNPPWSWYAGDAAATALFEMTGGARFVYTGSWCSPGRETSWNGSWRLSAEHGTALWDGDSDPQVEDVRGGRTAEDAEDPATPARSAVGEGIAGSLAAFLEALDGGPTPMGEVHGNVLSLVMVEAAVESSARRGRVMVDEILERALAKAVEAEARDDVRAALASWSSAREALTGAPSVLPG
ncbi:Gfo/Idh/MocA family protein [Nesterenkonia sp. F]|uniref:Gfo/Idh/MocA family protein n=1 Tax=Nesterenkonia sp. F TaxID=795955 RepID=UPI000255C994|nr:Gfo/Idh/MocA family oxidoreductase [Nesterenkonia sp. F]